MSKRYSNTERIGVNKVESIILNKFNWIFREQPISWIVGGCSISS